MEHILKTFYNTKGARRAALMPYYPLGYPSLNESQAIVESIAAAGANLIELGIPFSDPLADRPTIQRATQIALQQGASLPGCLELAARLRAGGLSQPLLPMGYHNPILASGVERFVADASAAGADGFIVPDLPPEEASQLLAACQAHDRSLVFMLAPTSTPQRIARIVAQASGFLYLVSLTGVTGARQALLVELETFTQKVRQQTDLPLAVGFGISTPEQAAAIDRLVEGVVVGSALINVIEGAADPCLAAELFVGSLRQAMERSQ